MNRDKGADYQPDPENPAVCVSMSTIASDCSWLVSGPDFVQKYDFIERPEACSVLLKHGQRKAAPTFLGLLNRFLNPLAHRIALGWRFPPRLLLD